MKLGEWYIDACHNFCWFILFYFLKMINAVISNYKQTTVFHKKLKHSKKSRCNLADTNPVIDFETLLETFEIKLKIKEN